MKRRSDETIIAEIQRLDKLRLQYTAEDKLLHARVVNEFKNVLRWTLGIGPKNSLERLELTLLLPEENDKKANQ